MPIKLHKVAPRGIKCFDCSIDPYKWSIRVVFACPCNAVGNMHPSHGRLEDIILSAPVYADDHHPATGHMHGVMHSDASVIAPEARGARSEARAALRAPRATPV